MSELLTTALQKDMKVNRSHEGLKADRSFERLEDTESIKTVSPWSPYAWLENVEVFTINQSFLFGDLNDRYRLREPIPVIIEVTDDLYTVYWTDLDVFGYGPTSEDAFQDIKEVVVELFEKLGAESISSLSPRLRKELDILENSIEQI